MATNAEATAADGRYNRRNPGVKRILQEVKEMQSNPSPDFIALPLEDNLFEWQFAIRGPRDSEFEGGIFHGRIQLPPEYPFKPPAFMLITPNGRFETQTKICLSISNYHPEHWQPSWSVRTALVALIAFMPTKAEGALGSLEYKKEERQALAMKSREAPPKYGNPERQKLIDEIHEYMLGKVPPLPASPTTNQNAETISKEADSNPDANAIIAPEEIANQEPEQRAVEAVHEVHVNAAAGPVRVSFSAGVSLSSTHGREATKQTQTPARIHKPVEDRLFTWAALGLTVAILILIIKKLLKSNELAEFVGI